MSANISIIGNLGKTPETKITDNGTLVASFSMASNSFRNAMICLRNSPPPSPN